MFATCFDSPEVLDDIGLHATAPPADHATHDLVTTKLCDFVLLLAANRTFSLSQHEVPSHSRHTMFFSCVCVAYGPRLRPAMNHRATLIRNECDCRAHIAVRCQIVGFRGSQLFNSWGLRRYVSASLVCPDARQRRVRANAHD
jgi:hypothetical protein